MVGDRIADVAAGHAAGCRTIRIGVTEADDPPADFDAADLDTAAEVILNINHGAAPAGQR